MKSLYVPARAKSTLKVRTPYGTAVDLDIPKDNCLLQAAATCARYYDFDVVFTTRASFENLNGRVEELTAANAALKARIDEALEHLEREDADSEYDAVCALTGSEG